MDFTQYEALVNSLNFGKKLPTAIYIHNSGISFLPEKLNTLVNNISEALGISENWNIAKFAKRDFKLTLLSYPDFESYPYPALQKSYTINLENLSLREANYAESDNPPILHRRETFLAPGDERITEYSVFTKEGENIGLYENTKIIGFKTSWERLIKRKGYFLDAKGHIFPLSEKTVQESEASTDGTIDRHKTAISRDKLSTPMFLLSQKGFLNGQHSVLDYGCGLGDDLRELEAHDIECMGWDPVHRPDVDIENCDIVNLGFVINVIEDRHERSETLSKAFEYADKLLLVSAMLGNEKVYERFKPFKDGVITARNTFQKYYTQGELKQYIEDTLDNSAIALGPGVFIVFKDKIEEQSFLLEKQRIRRQWNQITTRVAKPIEKKQAKALYEKHQPLFDDFWYTTLELGRLPLNDEFEQTEQLRQVAGSHNKALSICKQYFEEEDYSQARTARIEDLSVYFALGFFRKRDAYIRMPISLQRDIKEFFGSYTAARDAGKELLFSLANPEVIYDACVRAHETLPASQLNEQHDFIFHKDYLDLCPAVLRTYIGCATQMYGELAEVSLIKAHILSGKVTLMVFDDWEKDTPMLTERIKIKMREQDIDFFDYVGDYAPQPLLNKDCFEV